MAKRPTITTVTTGFQSGTTINSNLEALRDGFDNTLSLDGSAPNAMGADLDMNSNDILNAGTVNATELKVGGSTFVPGDAVGLYTPEWEGAWLTATAYAVNDLVRENGNVYICLEAHTSGTFSTDLAAAKWELFASKGDSGLGTGDLLAANNLSDLDNTDTALANLGGGTVGIAIFKDTTAAAVRAELDLETGTDIQAYNANLASLAGITLQQGDLLYATGANTLVRLAKGTANQVLQINSGATAPEWATVSGFGVGQSWATATRTGVVSYQNTSGKPIQVNGQLTTGTSGGGEGAEPLPRTLQVSSDGLAWVTVATSGSVVGNTVSGSAVVPNNHYYRFSTTTTASILS